MAAWSNILRSTGEKVLRIGSISTKNAVQTLQKREMGHGPRVFRIEPTRWQWNKCKDMLHFYTALGVIPLSILTFVVYVFVGPAQLAEIPEGYVPKHWEYYKNPITRFIMKHFNESHQEVYERTMHMMYEETRRGEITGLQNRIKELIKQRKDYQEYYYIPYNAERIYEKRELNEFIEEPLHEIDEEDKQKMREGKYGRKTNL
ncbi:NADH dehydrogenase [ubiquinone] 1 beta subcomplex subunit 5, mitochondrial [Leptopilina heterotoma]|uniref:NADH dehydrogenase [ubiquinone] 1 beta subcomplex subunit 5, mitochondrial n=1 Tax=Leptopilina heterotoma TaxID=63436 RepID=UPI001CA7F4DE|nr:NADH dehydrogenase [ubiquinone] 1 beta subcomplex subunit 5, mitochondrial [Leptopilina heterotoma]XP_043483737.1 NADH dehydrogenase [ubiquinone] 1 beta subcomplex subunit 5, mitochondrial [Leptopilina heterotoma]